MLRVLARVVPHRTAVFVVTDHDGFASLSKARCLGFVCCRLYGRDAGQKIKPEP